jgi:hypothetical protein
MSSSSLMSNVDEFKLKYLMFIICLCVLFFVKRVLRKRELKEHEKELKLRRSNRREKQSNATIINKSGIPNPGASLSQNKINNINNSKKNQNKNGSSDYDDNMTIYSNYYFEEKINFQSSGDEDLNAISKRQSGKKSRSSSKKSSVKSYKSNIEIIQVD